MQRFDIINHLIAKHGYRYYFEIGVRDGQTFSRVKAENKGSVDPVWPATWAMTSDEFFNMVSSFPLPPRYDLIFIDGLHTADQVERDITNSLRFLAVGGTIVVHDCNPSTEAAQSDVDNGGMWNGTVWKAWVKLKFTRRDLVMRVVDTDEGCGIITFGKSLQPPPLPPSLDYAYFAQHRRELLGLISIEEFLKDG